jgi:hypothetical protein
MRTCMGMTSPLPTVCTYRGVESIYVSNQRLPRTDLYANASASGVLRSPLVLEVLLRLVEHPPIRPNATAEAAGLPRDV